MKGDLPVLSGSASEVATAVDADLGAEGTASAFSAILHVLLLLWKRGKKIRGKGGQRLYPRLLSWKPTNRREGKAVLRRESFSSFFFAPTMSLMS